MYLSQNNAKIHKPSDYGTLITLLKLCLCRAHIIIEPSNRYFLFDDCMNKLKKRHANTGTE